MRVLGTFYFFLYLICWPTAGQSPCLEETLRLVRLHGLERAVQEFGKFHDKLASENSDEIVQSLLELQYEKIDSMLKNVLKLSSLEQVLEVSRALGNPSVEQLVSHPQSEETISEKNSDERYVSGFHVQQGNHPEAFLASIKTSPVAKKLVGHGSGFRFVTSPLIWGYDGQLAMALSEGGNPSDKNTLEVFRIRSTEQGVNLLRKTTPLSAPLRHLQWVSRGNLVGISEENDAKLKYYQLAPDSNDWVERSSISILGKIRNSPLSVGPQGLIAVTAPGSISFFELRSNGLFLAGRYFTKGTLHKGISWDRHGNALVVSQVGNKGVLEIVTLTDFGGIEVVGALELPFQNLNTPLPDSNDRIVVSTTAVRGDATPHFGIVDIQNPEKPILLKSRSSDSEIYEPYWLSPEMFLSGGKYKEEFSIVFTEESESLHMRVYPLLRNKMRGVIPVVGPSLLFALQGESSFMLYRYDERAGVPTAILKTGLSGTLRWGDQGMFSVLARDGGFEIFQLQ